MNVTDMLAAGLNFDFDFEKIKQEILKLKPIWVYTPPTAANIAAGLRGAIFMTGSEEMYKSIDNTDIVKDPTIKKEYKGQWVFYMRRHINNPSNITNFSITKNLPTEGWSWIDQVAQDAPYTVQCIESLPFKKIGCIRVFITENTFFPTHRDYGMFGPAVQAAEYEKTLGVSLLPDTGGVPMSIQSYKTNEIYEVTGNAMLFNDSAWHGVKFTPGMRITIRVFGEVDYQDFVPYIDSSRVFY